MPPITTQRPPTTQNNPGSKATKVRVHDEEWLTADGFTIYGERPGMNSTNLEPPTPAAPPLHMTELAVPPMSER